MTAVISGYKVKFYELMALIIPGYTATVFFIVVFGGQFTEIRGVYIPVNHTQQDVLFTIIVLVSGPIVGSALVLMGQFIYRIIHKAAVKVSSVMRKCKPLEANDRVYGELIDVWGMELFAANMTVLMVIVTITSSLWNSTFFQSHKHILIGSMLLFLLMTVYFEFRVYEYCKFLLKNQSSQQADSRRARTVCE